MLRRAATTILIAAGVAVGGTLIARRLGYNLGTNTIVRCRQGHVFTTIWIPGIKLKEIDLVVARIQRCPVGNHWSLVVPIRAETLSAEDRDFALSHQDRIDVLLDASSRSRYYPRLAAASSDAAIIPKLEAYAKEHLPAASRSSVERVVAAIRDEVRVREKQLPQVSRWLEGRPG